MNAEIESIKTRIAAKTFAILVERKLKARRAAGGRAAASSEPRHIADVMPGAMAKLQAMLAGKVTECPSDELAITEDF